MDDELKRQIAASMDRPSDAEADARVVRAMADDPAVEAWARGLYTLDHAMRTWPEVRRGEKSWGRLADRIARRLDGAKGGRGRAVTPEDDASIAAPAFDDDPAPPREQQTKMSETNEHDADLEGLAALTRISQVPGAMPSTPPRSVGPSLLDAPDDTSSGLVDMKSLAQLTREAASSMPAPAPAVEEKPAAAEPAPALAKKPEKTDDVMVRPKPAAVALPEVPELTRRGGNTWLGALGGVAVASLAFFFMSRSQAPTPSVDSSSQSVQPPAPAVPVGSAAPSTQTAPAESTPTQPPEAAPPAAPPPSALAPAVAAPAAEPPAPAPPAEPPSAPAPTPAPEPEGARQAPRAREERARVATRTAEPAATTAATARPEAPAAPPAPPPGARPAPAPSAPPAAAPARPSNVDDLIARAAGGATPTPAAAPAAPAAAPELPERLTRPQITSVMSGLNGAVRACAQGQTGTAPVAVVIGNDGNVRSASVSGQFAGGAIGECIEGVVRRAHFPQFRANQISVTWPFVVLPPR